MESQQNITLGDRERLFGYLEGGGKIILPEPQALLTKASRMPGLDGQKMSKSYGNHIPMFAPDKQLKKRVMSIVTERPNGGRYVQDEEAFFIALCGAPPPP